MKNWYIVQSHSSFENKVAGLIKEEAEKAKVSDKIEEIIDSRTSDAIALAIRFDSPIFTYESVLEKAGIELKVEELNKIIESLSSSQGEFTNQQQILGQAVVDAESSVTELKNELGCKC